MGPLEIARVGFALFVLAYLPGRIWVAVLLPRVRSRLERAAASIVLSIGLLVLALYSGNLVGDVPISAATAFAWSAAIGTLGLGALLATRIQGRFVIVK